MKTKSVGGFKQNDHNATIACSALVDVSVEEHGDDFLVDGLREELLVLQKNSHEAFVNMSSMADVDDKKAGSYTERYR